MNKRVSVILSFVLAVCLLTAIFVFTASAEKTKPENEVVTTMFYNDFEGGDNLVGESRISKSTNRDVAEVEQKVVKEEGAEPEVVNRYGKIYATSTAAHGSAGFARYEIYPCEVVRLAETNYITFDIDISTENGYFDGGSTAICFNSKNAANVESEGDGIKITRFSNKWYINTTDGPYTVADNNEWFHLSLIIDVEADDKEGYGGSFAYVFVNGVDTGLTHKVFGDASTDLQSIRINSDANVSLASVDRSICFDNVVVNKVTESEEGDAGSLAWLLHNNKPLADWHATVYTDEYLLPKNLPLYEGMPKAMWYSVENGATTEYSTVDYTTLGSLLNKEGDVEIHLLADFIIDNETTAADSGPDIFTLSKEGTKNIYLHGHTLQHSPQYQGAQARGQFFYISCTGELTINFYGGTEEEGMGTLSRIASAQSMFRGVRGNHDNVKINMYGVNLTTEGSTGGYISDGYLYGSDFYFEDCHLYIRVFNVESNTAASSVTYKNCDIYVETIGTYVGANTVVTYEDCRISTASGVPAMNFRTSPKAYIKGNTVINTETLSNANSYITVGEGVTVFDSALINGVKYEEACYLTSVTESIPPEEEGGEPTEVTTYKVMKATLPIMYANLTLYSDFSYNLYIPTDAGIKTVDGFDVTTLEVVRVYEKECYVYTKAGINTIEAAKDIVFTFVGSPIDDENATDYTVKKTASILDYAETVLASENAEVVKGRALVVDMLKYISEAYKFFAAANTEVDALLEGHTPSEYAPTETEVANYADLTTWIMGAYISLDGNCPKYVLVAEGAYKVTVTYTTIDGSTVTVEKTFTATGEKFEIEMRAYDLYKTLTITAETVIDEGETPMSASGEYNLYTYIQGIATDIDADNDASLELLKALYNFSKSSEAYKLGR